MIGIFVAETSGREAGIEGTLRGPCGPKKYRIRYWKKFVLKKYRIWYWKYLVSEKSIGFGIGNIWYRKKVLDSVLFRFLVSSHTDHHEDENPPEAEQLVVRCGEWNTHHENEPLKHQVFFFFSSMSTGLFFKKVFLF